jgi:hypothetical protein
MKIRVAAGSQQGSGRVTGPDVSDETGPQLDLTGG